jgi:hypothetical protein
LSPLRPHETAAEQEATMLRCNTILTTAALMAVFAVPASAQTYDDLRSPDAKDAAAQRGLYESDSGPYVLERSYGSPDAADATRDLPPVPVAARPGTHSQPGPYPESERELVESPEVQGMVRRTRREIREIPTVIEVHGPSAGFDWGDAGIGAAGMLALFSIAAGSALMLIGRRRREGVGVATH